MCYLLYINFLHRLDLFLLYPKFTIKISWYKFKFMRLMLMPVEHDGTLLDAEANLFFSSWLEKSSTQCVALTMISVCASSSTMPSFLVRVWIFFFLYLFLDSAIYFIITYLTVEMLSPISWAISLNFLNAIGLLFDYIPLNLISIIYLSRSRRSSYLFLAILAK